MNDGIAILGAYQGPAATRPVRGLTAVAEFCCTYRGCSHFKRHLHSQAKHTDGYDHGSTQGLTRVVHNAGTLLIGAGCHNSISAPLGTHSDPEACEADVEM